MISDCLYFADAFRDVDQVIGLMRGEGGGGRWGRTGEVVKLTVGDSSMARVTSCEEQSLVHTWTFFHQGISKRAE